MEKETKKKPKKGGAQRLREKRAAELEKSPKNPKQRKISFNDEVVAQAAVPTTSQVEFISLEELLPTKVECVLDSGSSEQQTSQHSNDASFADKEVKFTLPSDSTVDEKLAFWFGRCASGHADQSDEFGAQDAAEQIDATADSILALQPIFDMELGQPTENGSVANKLDELGATKEVIKYPPQFFQLKGSKGVDTLVYYCLLGDCSRKGKTLSACVNSRGNLRKHIKAQHTSHLDEFNRLCKELDLEKGSCSGKVESTAESSSFHRKFQPQQPSCTGHSDVLAQDVFDSCILEYLVQGLYPVSETTKDFFRNFVLALASGKKIQSPAFYDDHIEKDFVKKRDLLKNHLALATWVCTTADCWSSKGRQFLGVTVHWLDEKLERKSAYLAIKPVNGLCDYQNIATKLEAIYEEFDIARKVVATITDNGSNFEKKSRIYGASALLPVSKQEASICRNKETAATGCKAALPYATQTQVECCQAFDKDEDNVENLLNGFSSNFSESEEDEFKTDSESKRESHINELASTSSSKERNNASKYLRNVVSDEEPELIIPLTEILQSTNSASLMFNFPTHRRCASHTLSLIAKVDVVKRSEPMSLKIRLAVNCKIRQITKYHRRNPNTARGICEELEDLFVIKNSIRWNSWFSPYQRMALCLTKSRNEIRKLFQHFAVPFFRPVEEEYIKEFVQVVRPLAEALDVLKPDVDVSAAYLLPTLKILLEEMTSLEMLELKVCKNLPTVIKEAVYERFAGYFEDEELIIATILHPKFKIWWLPVEQRTRHVNKLREICKCLHAQDEESENLICSNSQTEEADDTQQYYDSPKRCKMDFFSSISRRKESRNESTEVERYLEDSNENVETLDKYPTLKRLFRKYNAALPSSASCERLFGVAGRISSPVRSRVSDKKFEQLLFLKFNSKMLL